MPLLILLRSPHLSSADGRSSVSHVRSEISLSFVESYFGQADFKYRRVLRRPGCLNRPKDVPANLTRQKAEVPFFLQ